MRTHHERSNRRDPQYEAPTLREDQIEILKRYGQTRKTEVGDVLFRAGDTSNDLLPADGYSHLGDAGGADHAMSDTPGACLMVRGQTLSKRRAPTFVLMPQTWLSNKFPDGPLSVVAGWRGRRVY